MKKLLLNSTSFGEEEKLMSKKKKKINVEDETCGAPFGKKLYIL